MGIPSLPGLRLCLGVSSSSTTESSRTQENIQPSIIHRAPTPYCSSHFEPSLRPRRSSPRASSVHSPLQAIDTRPKALDNIPDMSDFVELGLELIDLSDDFPEASNLGVSGSHRSAGARGLVDGGGLGLRCELHHRSVQSKLDIQGDGRTREQQEQRFLQRGMYDPFRHKGTVNIRAPRDSV